MTPARPSPLLRHKTWIAAGVLACLAAVPMAQAHLTSASKSIGGGLDSLGPHLDPYRLGGATPRTDGAVSGNYVMRANGYLEANGLPPTDVEVTTPSGVYCHLQSLGGYEEPLLNEDDNTPPGDVPDGTWDDGGIGGACHHLTGCPSGEVEHAEDVLLGGEVLIGTACDMLVQVPGTGSPDAIAFALCLVNNVGTEVAPENAPPCVVAAASCALSPANCVAPALLTCGADDEDDAISYGEGGGHTGGGVAFPPALQDSSGNTCPNNIGNSIVYVAAGVDSDFPAVGPCYGDGFPPSCPEVVVSVPVAGWIDGDWGDPASSSSAFPPREYESFHLFG